MTYIAQDTFVAESPNGAWVTVVKGQAFPDSHPLVVMDREAADAAAKGKVERSALFAPIDFGEEEEPAPAPKAAKSAPRKGA